jgi:hypothetical protein
MKREFMFAVTALSIFAGGQAMAQTAVIQLEPQQRTVIKEYVVKQKVKPVTVRERITVGATLPGDVELMTVPTEWGPSLSRYRYVYSGDNVVLVDPSSRRVIQIVD